MPFRTSSRFRKNQNYFLLRVAHFEHFRDPDAFSPHMDLIFIRRVNDEFQEKLPEIRFDATGFESTSCVLATRPERAARDLARRFLISNDARYEIEILNTQGQVFTIRYRKPNTDAWSVQIETAFNWIVFSDDEPYNAENEDQTYTVELPFLAQTSVFVQFFRLEPSFQFYEYAVVIDTIQERKLRLPGGNDDPDYVPLRRKIAVKSMFRPFLISQRQHQVIQKFSVSANNARDAFVKAKDRLWENNSPITITDIVPKHRFVNNLGHSEFKFVENSFVANVGQFRRRADNKRRRTHCIEHTFLFELEQRNLNHVVHTTMRTNNAFFRSLRNNLTNAIHKFKAIIQSERMDGDMKESATFVMLRNRWFLMACAILTEELTEELDPILSIAFAAINSKNPTRQTLSYEEFPNNLYGSFRAVFEDMDDDDIVFNHLEDQFVEVEDHEQLEARNLPVPPSLGCEPNPNEINAADIRVDEGHDPFPNDYLTGPIVRTFANWDAEQHYTRAFVLDTYTKQIRDDVKRIVKRNTPFIQYLGNISINEINVNIQQEHAHFGKSRGHPTKIGRVILHALRRFLRL
jgi:hypothetical protein